jgi:hypothetical protein
MEQAALMKCGVATGELTGVREKCRVKITSCSFHPSTGAEKLLLVPNFQLKGCI